MLKHIYQTNTNNSHPLEVVGHGSETQRRLDKNLNKINFVFQGLP